MTHAKPAGKDPKSHTPSNNTNFMEDRTVISDIPSAVDLALTTGISISECDHDLWFS